ncbi:hypothetical protein N7G274_001489 [Stereocaulon virgatum]|uniref:Uncharacterized protein n=1 Tax=Stereocaulon virgatum TaxID=373712 RepID=A0ABR4AJT7_9LECA
MYIHLYDNVWYVCQYCVHSSLSTLKIKAMGGPLKLAEHGYTTAKQSSSAKRHSLLNSLHSAAKFRQSHQQHPPPSRPPHPEPPAYPPQPPELPPTPPAILRH